MNDASHTPKAAILTWWRAMQDGDLEALAALVLDDYISAGGPGPRILGRGSFLAEAREFLAGGAITHWAVNSLQVRVHDDVAVCSYLWHETGTFGGEPFALAGIATDVLLRRDGSWRHQAHHVSLVSANSPEPVAGAAK
jgi:uncharacterized protein (TIGR02246 family)